MGLLERYDEIRNKQVERDLNETILDKLPPECFNSTIMNYLQELRYIGGAEYESKELLNVLLSHAKMWSNPEDFYNAFIQKLWKINYKDLRKEQVDGIAQFHQGLLLGQINSDGVAIFLQTKRIKPKLSSKLK